MIQIRDALIASEWGREVGRDWAAARGTFRRWGGWRDYGTGQKAQGRPAGMRTGETTRKRPHIRREGVRAWVDIQGGGG